MFLVVSFDFGGSSNVALHACTTDEEAAKALYDCLVTKYAPANAKAAAEDNGCARLVELVRVDGNNFLSDKGYVLFWGSKHDKLVCVNNNNDTNDGAHACGTLAYT
jgi:hypothetical protein